MNIDSAVFAEGLAALKGQLTIGVETDATDLIARVTVDIGVDDFELVEHSLEFGIIKTFFFAFH